MEKKLILIAGPTASGKSNLSIKLSKKINGEIINADSMQVYKEISILSSRPSPKELKKVNHHLYGFISVNKHFSVGHWLKIVKKKIKQILKKNKIPILVGGTGLYFNAIIKGISKIPPINNHSRKKIRDLHKKIGQKKFYDKLIKIDPISKKLILPSDTQRTIRAYEVKFLTKKSIHLWSANTASEFKNFDIKKIYLDPPRELLLKSIKRRTNLMVKKNCINEVKDFLNLKIEKSLSANKIIGVSEISDYLSGLLSIEQVIELINIKTRQYAKRQRTWSRGYMKNWNKLYSKNNSTLIKKILKAIS